MSLNSSNATMYKCITHIHVLLLLVLSGLKVKAMEENGNLGTPTTSNLGNLTAKTIIEALYQMIIGISDRNKHMTNLLKSKNNMSYSCSWVVTHPSINPFRRCLTMLTIGPV